MPGRPAISGKALASCVLPWLACCVLFAAIDVETASSPARRGNGIMVSLVVGFLTVTLAVLGLIDIRRSRGRLRGRGFAIAGLTVIALTVPEYLVLVGLEKVRGARVSVQSAHNLLQQALALHAYADAKGTLPPAAVYGMDGRPLLSWRVLLLPYLGHEDLFRKFKLDEPWDSPHNLPLLANMPEVYAPPQGVATKEPHATFYQVFVGQGAAFEGKEGVRLSDFPDGRGDTFLVVEAGEAVPWTKPQDLPYAADRPLPRLGGISSYCVRAAMADTAVRLFQGEETSEEMIRARVTRNGGEQLRLAR
jgi:hypothetical protein